MQGLVRAAEIPRAKNNRKNNARSNPHQPEIRAACLRPVRRRNDRQAIRRPPQTKSPAAERRRARISVTRISATAHSSAECTLQSAPVIPAKKRSRYSRRMIASALNGCCPAPEGPPGAERKGVRSGATAWRGAPSTARSLAETGRRRRSPGPMHRRSVPGRRHGRARPALRLR